MHFQKKCAGQSYVLLVLQELVKHRWECRLRALRAESLLDFHWVAFVMRQRFVVIEGPILELCQEKLFNLSKKLVHQIQYFYLMKLISCRLILEAIHQAHFLKFLILNKISLSMTIILIVITIFHALCLLQPQILCIPFHDHCKIEWKSLKYLVTRNLRK